MPTNVDRFFGYAHLPEHLQEVSRIFAEAQQRLETLVPDSAEKSAGARKLLEAKDAYVRASLPPQ